MALAHRSGGGAGAEREPDATRGDGGADHPTRTARRAHRAKTADPPLPTATPSPPRPPTGPGRASSDGRREQ
eukprot:5265431-Alexandrium_andersonii.AAC.1